MAIVGVGQRPAVVGVVWGRLGWSRVGWGGLGSVGVVWGRLGFISLSRYRRISFAYCSKDQLRLFLALPDNN